MKVMYVWCLTHLELSKNVPSLEIQMVSVKVIWYAKLLIQLFLYQSLKWSFKFLFLLFHFSNTLKLYFILLFKFNLRLCICNLFNETVCNYGYQGYASFSNNGGLQFSNGSKICWYPKRKGTEKSSTASNESVEFIWNQSKCSSNCNRKSAIPSGKNYHIFYR